MVISEPAYSPPTCAKYGIIYQIHQEWFCVFSGCIPSPLSSPHVVLFQELAEEVQKVVEPLRDQLDAVVVFPSMPEVMRLNKVGSFTMQNLGQSKSVVSDFMKKKKKASMLRVGVYRCYLATTNSTHT